MDGLVPALMEGAFQYNGESFHSKSYIWRPKEYHKTTTTTLYHLSVFHCGVNTTKTSRILWLEMQRHVPTSG